MVHSHLWKGPHAHAYYRLGIGVSCATVLGSPSTDVVGVREYGHTHLQTYFLIKFPVSWKTNLPDVIQFAGAVCVRHSVSVSVLSRRFVFLYSVIQGTCAKQGCGSTRRERTPCALGSGLWALGHVLPFSSTAVPVLRGTHTTYIHTLACGPYPYALISKLTN